MTSIPTKNFNNFFKTQYKCYNISLNITRKDHDPPDHAYHSAYFVAAFTLFACANLNESVIEPLNESLDKPHDELPDNQPLVLDTMTVTYTPAYRGDVAPEELPQSTDVLDSSLLAGPTHPLYANAPQLYVAR